MGYGSYSHDAHRALTEARTSLPTQSVFAQRGCHPLMSPHGLRARESRDSGAHPDSRAIVFALDVTGSMGEIPAVLAKKELPSFVQQLMDAGVADPQILFLAIGDAYTDRAPLQIGQFESEAQKMDFWLTNSFLEGGGGSHNAESYELALYVGARHTAIDCIEKRGKRGYFFMTGDELPYPFVSHEQVKALIGDDLVEDVPIAAVVDEISRLYHPFFLIPDLARRARCEKSWRDLLGDHVICLERPADTCAAAAGIVALVEGSVADVDDLARRLEAAGEPRERIGAVHRALTPFAATLRRDGTPKPALDEARLPIGNPPSGYGNG